MTTILNEASFEQEDTQHGRYLTFSLGDEEYGIEIRYVTEIIGLQPVTAIPEAPEYVRGIVNLRGKIIPVIDMRLKLKKPAIAYTDRTCIVVLDTGRQSAGIIVDRVSEVISIDDEQVVPPPDIRSGIQNRYIKGIGKANGTVKLLLDCQELFLGQEAQAVSGNNENEKVQKDKEQPK